MAVRQQPKVLYMCNISFFFGILGVDTRLGFCYTVNVGGVAAPAAFGNSLGCGIWATPQKILDFD